MYEEKIIEVSSRKNKKGEIETMLVKIRKDDLLECFVLTAVNENGMELGKMYLDEGVKKKEPIVFTVEVKKRGENVGGILIECAKTIARKIKKPIKIEVIPYEISGATKSNMTKEQLKRFYEQHGFEIMKNNPKHMILLPNKNKPNQRVYGGFGSEKLSQLKKLPKELYNKILSKKTK